MGLTQKLGTIPLAISTDASNNIGIGGSPSGSYKLEVTGTAKVSGNLQLGSTTASSTTTPITLNTGGTYGTTLLNGIKIKMFDDGTTVHGLGVIAGNLYLNATDAATKITLNTNNTERLAISSTGAATFSSTLQSASSTISDVTASTYWYNNFNSSENRNWAITYGQADLGDFNIMVSNAQNGNPISAGSVKLNIRKNGNVLIGKTSDNGSRFQVFGDTRLTGTSNDSGANAIYCENNLAATMFYVRNDGVICSGTAANSPYNLVRSGRVMMVDSNGLVGYQSSTRESKTNINNLTDISFLYKLNPVSFNYRKSEDTSNIFTNEYNEDLHYGLIADEVEKVNKELVFYNEKDGVKELAGVEYGKLTAVLIKAIQELNQQNQDLKSRLDKAGL